MLLEFPALAGAHLLLASTLLLGSVLLRHSCCLLAFLLLLASAVADIPALAGGVFIFAGFLSVVDLLSVAGFPVNTDVLDVAGIHAGVHFRD